MLGCAFSRLSITFISTLDFCLNDIIVTLGAIDLAEETHELCLLLSGQLFQRLLEPVSFLLTEANACPLVNLSLSHEIWDSTDRST